MSENDREDSESVHTIMPCGSLGLALIYMVVHNYRVYEDSFFINDMIFSITGTTVCLTKIGTYFQGYLWTVFNHIVLG